MLSSLARSLARPSDVLPQARHATAAARPSVRPMGRPEKKSTAFSTTAAAAAKKPSNGGSMALQRGRAGQAGQFEKSLLLAARVFGANERQEWKCSCPFVSKVDERHSFMPPFMNNLKSQSFPDSRSIASVDG